MSRINFHIPLPQSRDGYSRRKCADPSCSRAFHLQTKDAPSEIYCPYCGATGTIQETHSPEDVAYAAAVGREKAIKYAHDEFAKVFSNAFGGSSSGSFIKFTPSSQPYREKRIAPRPVTEKVDTPLVCPECQFGFKVYGIFGYCPRCRSENVQIYDENLSILKAEIARAANAPRALRSAYSDLVSTMEDFFKRKTVPDKHPANWFQRLPNIDALATAKTGNSLGELVSVEELNALKHVFGKRHLIIHNGARIDEKYLGQFPGEPGAVGDAVPLTVEEFDLAAIAMRKIIGAVFVPAGHHPRS